MALTENANGTLNKSKDSNKCAGIRLLNLTILIANAKPSNYKIQ